VIFQDEYIKFGKFSKSFFVVYIFTKGSTFLYNLLRSSDITARFIACATQKTISCPSV